MLEVDIRKRLGDFTLDVSFSVGNELVAIFGPSGSGKTLTLQCLAGLLRPDEGRIAFNGRVVFDTARGIDVPPQQRRVGYVFQNYALLPHLTVWDNVAYGLHRLPRAEREERTQKMLVAMRLVGLEQRRPAELSGGQQQRVALARALVTEPQLLLLDEPFSALDSAIRSRLHGELLQLLRGLPITTVLVTHNLQEAYALSEKMIVYDAGKVLQIGPREEVLRRPASRAVARFTGTKNLFRGTVLHKSGEQLAVRAGDLVVRTPMAPCQEGDAVDFCIRPEEIMLLRPQREAGAAVEENRFWARVVGEVARGPSFTLLLKLEGDPLHNGRDYDLHVDIPANVYYRLGVDRQRHWEISLKKEAIHVIGPAAKP